MHMYVKYVYVHTCMDTFTHINAYIYVMCVCTQIYICMSAYIHTGIIDKYMHLYMHACTYRLMYAYLYTHLNVCIHIAYTHTYIRIAYADTGDNGTT